MSEQKVVDWAHIEADYRAGIKSLRQIGDDQGVTEGAIRKRAKKEGWERDLEKRVQLQAEAKVRREAVRNTEREATRVPESAIIEANADLVAGVTLGHRKDIKRSRELAMTLLEEVEDQTLRRDLYEQLGALLYAPDDNGKDKLSELYHKVISSAGRIDSMKKLADTLKTLVGLERQAYGLDKGDEGTGSYEDFLDQL